MPASVAPSHPAGSAPARPNAETLRMLLRIQHFEEKLLELFQAGKLNGTTHTCLGQEYIPVAVMPLLRDEDFVFSNHRGHGHYLARFNDPEGLMAEIMGREGAVCGGVGGSQHIRRGRYYSTGIQGQSLPVAVGAAMQAKRDGNGALALAFIGDGTWGEGAVYEGLNMASLWQVPLVVIVENNGIAQSTPRELNTAGTIEARAKAFGVQYFRCTGHDVVALRASIWPVIESVRAGGGPVVIEFKTMRLASHSKGDDTRAPEEVAALREQSWAAEYAAAFPEEFAAADAAARAEIDALAAELEKRPLSTAKACTGQLPNPPAPLAQDVKAERVLENLNRALHATMESDDRVIFIGEDVLDPYGGAFKVARGLSTRFPARVITTPISELGLAGVANGLALAERRVIAELMFGDFIFLAADQIINFAAKTVTMYGERVPHSVVFRCPVGGHRGYGATHSQTVQKHFIGVPNLDLFELSPLHDMTRLLPWLLARGNPAILFESKTLYGQPRIVGNPVDDLFSLQWLDDDALTAGIAIDSDPQVVLVTGGGTFAACLHAARQLFLEFEIGVQIVVPFQLYPFEASVIRDHLPVYVAEESTAGGTWGAEVAAAIGRQQPRRKAPVVSLHSADAIIPSARHLERQMLLQPEDIVRRIAEDVLDG